MAALPHLRRPLLHLPAVDVDLKVEEGWAIRTEPHPRFYTDPTDTTPIAVPALVRRWWPMIYFWCSNRRQRGRPTFFGPASHSSKCWSCRRRRRSISFRCRRTKLAERELQARRIYQSRSTLSAGTEWKSATNTVFDGTYRHILGAASKRRSGGPDSTSPPRVGGRKTSASHGQGSFGSIIVTVPPVMVMMVIVMPVMVVMMMVVMVMILSDNHRLRRRNYRRAHARPRCVERLWRWESDQQLGERTRGLQSIRFVGSSGRRSLAAAKQGERGCSAQQAHDGLVHVMSFSIVGTQTPNEIRRKKFQFMTSFAAGCPDHYALSRRNTDYSRAIRAETGAGAGGSSAKRWR